MTAHAAENALIAGVLGEPGSPARCRLAEGALGGAPLDWDYLCARAGLHGLAPLLLREAGSLDLEIPAAARSRLDQLAEYAQGRAKKCQFTLYRFLEVGARRGLDSALLKGAALVGTAYPDPRLRPMEDVDLLVRPEDAARACAVGEEIGLGLAEDQLPVFFHRLVHFSQSLQPDVETLVPLDLHWGLHSPALLYTDRSDRIWARRQLLQVYGFPTAVLDPADQWLHLATHFWSHWGDTPTRPPVAQALVEETGVEVALKWVADLVYTTRRLAAELPGAALASRAAEWSAEPETATALSLLAPLLATSASEFARDALDALGAPARTARATAADPIREVAHPALGFRLAALRRLPAWIAPPAPYLRAAAGLAPNGKPSAATRLRLRSAHTARVLGQIAVAALALPVAVLGRRLARAGRSRRIRASRSPARVALLLRKFSEFEVAYANRFVREREGRRNA